METNRVINGDSMNVLETLDAESVHAAVCDPPYGLAFMGRDWDDFEPREYQEWCENWARKARRVLKPGGHLLAFSGNRTHHRLFSGIEDAEFTVRDTITWHYGSGFPKALDVSKAIDNQADAEREVVGENPNYRNTESDKYNNPINNLDKTAKITEPATDAAEAWKGWKTCMKPATEFVVVARKPLGEDTVAENVQEHGTGALNIDGCRVECGERDERRRDVSGDAGNTYDGGVNGEWHGSEATGTTTDGRYPSNVVFDEKAATELDDEVGETTSHSGESWSDQAVAATQDVYGEYDGDRTVHSFDDSGGPSRYFYTSKASKSERTMDGRIDNSHPTVKPVDLMEWLVKLVTKEGQVVLDPFAGSGTTCLAAKNLQREFIGIEKQQQWSDVARVRCGLAPHDPSNVRSDDGPQQGLEVYTDGGAR